MGQCSARPHKPGGQVQLLNPRLGWQQSASRMTRWWKRQTHEAENLGPLRAWEFKSPPGYCHQRNCQCAEERRTKNFFAECRLPRLAPATRSRRLAAKTPVLQTGEAMVRVHPGSLNSGERGTSRAARPRGRHWYRTPEIGVRISGGPFAISNGGTGEWDHHWPVEPVHLAEGFDSSCLHCFILGSSSNGRIPVRQTGGLGSTPSGSISSLEGSRIRLAGPLWKSGSLVE
jgi:hypothetical protein